MATLALFFLATGCATRSQPNKARVPDWQSEQAVSVVSPPPVIAAPPEPGPEPPATPKAPAPVQPTETWVAFDRWAASQGLAAPKLVARAPQLSYAQETPAGTIILRSGTKVAHFAGLEVRLGFSPQSINGQLFVHRLDLVKTIVPLLGLAVEGFTPASAHNATGVSPVIVIDPGHGGTDSGTKAAGSDRYEKDLALDWARRVSRLLIDAGWQVFLTRTNDADVSLSNRVSFAQNCKADLFISLHLNSAPVDGGESGVETYCLTPAGMPSTVTREFADEVGSSFPNNAFDARNLQLAYAVHKQLVEVNGNQDRGIRRARFLTVLRGQQRPAVLIEGGYLSNRREATLIADPAYRQKLAEAVARALPARITVARLPDANSPATYPQTSAGNTNSIDERSD